MLVTPGEAVDELEISARTTSEFIKEFDVQVAINGSFFKPFKDDYPQRGDPVDVIGLAISNGVTYSSSETGVGVLCILADNDVQISEEHCPPDTTQALAGGIILVDHGTPLTSEDVPQDGLHPRTAVAIDEQGETLWLIVVDGRQSGYSEGVAMVELAHYIARELGADMALNLDGGGSTTLVVSDESSPRALNAPIHGGIPMLQRPVANHLGIYALPRTPIDGY
jgi:exopolysaccharide biosynthesis protein